MNTYEVESARGEDRHNPSFQSEVRRPQPSREQSVSALQAVQRLERQSRAN